MKKPGLLHLIKRALGQEPALHPVDHRMAKFWIKKRLIHVYPQLRNNPAALERAYRALSLEPREGDQEGEAETVFEMRLPEGHEDGPG